MNEVKMLPKILIAVFCGPWRTQTRFCGPDEGGQIDYDRIDAGIEKALSTKESGLLIVGDGNEGRDVRDFHIRATSCGVEQVFTCYDDRANTLSDAQGVMAALDTHPRLIRVQRIVVVTHSWHLQRARTMLANELKSLPEYDLRIEGLGVDAGPGPTAEMLLGESKGIRDYLAGNYGNSPVGKPVGKPVRVLWPQAK